MWHPFQGIRTSAAAPCVSRDLFSRRWGDRGAVPRSNLGALMVEYHYGCGGRIRRVTMLSHDRLKSGPKDPLVLTELQRETPRRRSDGCRRRSRGHEDFAWRRPSGHASARRRRWREHERCHPPQDCPARWKSSTVSAKRATPWNRHGRIHRLWNRDPAVTGPAMTLYLNIPASWAF